jgi:predicted methyltransferase
VNEHRCKTLVALVFFMTMFRVEKIKNSLHHSQRSTKNSTRGIFLKKDVMKKIQNIGFGLGFILIL